jgi:hypothetical protein
MFKRAAFRVAALSGAALLGFMEPVAGQTAREFIVVSAFPLAESASGRPQPNECDVIVQILNRHSERIDSLTIDLAVEINRSSRPEIRTVYFEQAPPTTERRALMTLSHRCADVVGLVLLDAGNCIVAGRRTSDCLERIETVRDTTRRIPVRK